MAVIPQFDLGVRDPGTAQLILGLGNAFQSSYAAAQKQAIEQRKQQALEGLGGLLSGENPSYKDAAGRLIAAGDLQSGIGLLGLADKMTDRQTARDQQKAFTDVLGLGGAVSAPDGSSGQMQTLGSPNEVESRFIGTIQKAGLSNPYGLAAIAATGKRESGFSPANVNRTWNDPSESGQAGTAGGVMSWRGPRLAALQQYAQQKGEAQPSVETQAEFLAKEDPTLIPRLNTAQSAQEANQIMANAWRFAGYNRPGGELGQRLGLTQQYAQRFAGGQRPTNAPGVQVAENEADVQRLEAQMAGQQPVQMAQAGNSMADLPSRGASEAQFVLPGQAQPSGRSALPPGDPFPNIPTQRLVQALSTGGGTESQRALAQRALDARQKWEAEGETRMIQRENLRLQQERSRFDLEERRNKTDPNYQAKVQADKVKAENTAREQEAERLGLQGDDRKMYVANGRVPNANEKLTNDQANAGLYADRMRKADVIISDPKITAAAQGLAQRGMAAIPVAGNFLVSEEYQKADQAQRDYINATLRRESGAAISPSEFENARKQYFPQPGDAKSVLEQKARNRQTAIDGISRAGGPTYAKENPPGTTEAVKQSRQPTAELMRGAKKAPDGNMYVPDPDRPGKWLKLERG